MKKNKSTLHLKYPILLVMLITSFLVQSQEELDFTINHILDTEKIPRQELHLPSIIFQGIEEGKIVCYKTARKVRKLSVESAFDKIMYSYDTVIVTDPNTYKDELTIIQNQRDLQKITSFLVQARYTIDVESGVVLRKTIHSIAPLDPFPEYKFGVERYKPYFWLDYDDVLNFVAKEPFSDDNGVNVDIHSLLQEVASINMISDISFGH